MPARSALGAVVAHTVRPASECHAHGEEEPRASGGEVDQQQAHEHRWREGHGEAHVAERDTIRPGRVWFSAPQCDQREEEQQAGKLSDSELAALERRLYRIAYGATCPRYWPV